MNKQTQAREIKFRMWNGVKMEYNIMAGWLGGFYVQGIDPNDTACMSPFNTKLTELTNVMQFTGLYDKNDKEIWEGDICKMPMRGHEITGVMIWDHTRAQFGLDAEVDFESPDHIADVSTRPEVIGNIYENPSLIP